MPAEAAADTTTFFARASYNLGGLLYSLDDIEHGILRLNRPHPSTGTLSFQPGDVRLAAKLPAPIGAGRHCQTHRCAECISWIVVPFPAASHVASALAVVATLEPD